MKKIDIVVYTLNHWDVIADNCIVHTFNRKNDTHNKPTDIVFENIKKFLQNEFS